jgi:RNase P/RNase MRP subunit p29
MMFKTICTALVTTSLLMSNIALSQTKEGGVIAGAVGVETGDILSASVSKIDKKNRTVSFKNKDGEFNIVAGPAVKNFDQIKVGDILDVRYELAVALELTKVKNPVVLGEQVSSSTATAKAGDKPGMIKTNVITTIAQVVKIDKKKQIVSIKGPKGNVVEVKVKEAALLKDIAVNDQVTAVYTEAVAAVISSPKK